MDFVDDTKIWPLLTELAAEQYVQSGEAGLPEPCFHGVVPGETLSFDYCQPCTTAGKCGTYWVRLVSMREIEGELGRRTVCAKQFEIDIEMGAIRCFQTVSAGGKAASPEQNEAAFRLQMAERQVIETVLRCGHKEYDPLLAQYSPIGPLGGCVGGSWTATYTLA